MAKKIEAKGGLSWLVQEMQGHELRPDEFTVRSAFELCKAAGVDATMDSIRHKLKRMDDNGLLTHRKASIEGRITKIYRKKP